jgi:hypothetical protein
MLPTQSEKEPKLMSAIIREEFILSASSRSVANPFAAGSL